MLYGNPDAAGKYPTSLTPDTSGNIRNMTVRFQTTGNSPTVLATAPLLFGTNNQINFLVPGVLANNIGTVNMVVSFGYGSGNTMLSSTPFPVTIAATNPGVYTVGADGQGQAAALAAKDFTLVGFGNEAGVRSTNGDSDSVMLFITGLGTPDSLGTNQTGGSAFPTDCTSIADHLAALNAQTGGTLSGLDGVILQASLLGTGRLMTCFDSVNVPTAKIGNVSGTVTYAGWVAGAVAGLYQMNVRLPNSTASYIDASGASLSAITATPVQLPIVVRSNSINSQAGVNLWVARKLKVVAPNVISGTVGTLWATSNNAVVATEGTGGNSAVYRYAVTSGLLPAGLSLSPTTGAITGTPAANTAGSYAVTVTASDNASVPVKDSVNFTLTVAGGLYMGLSTASPVLGTYGAGSATTTVTATGGIFPYTYSITAPGSLPAGMAINASTGVFTITSLTPAGSYTVTVHAVDSTSGTPLAGNATFTLTLALSVTNTNPSAGTNSQVNTGLTTVTATGFTTGVTYALDSTTAALNWITISNAGVVSTTNAAVAGTYPVTVTVTSTGTPTGGASAGTGTVTFNLVIN